MISLPTGLGLFLLIGLAIALAAGVGALFGLLDNRSGGVGSGVGIGQADADLGEDADRAA